MRQRLREYGLLWRAAAGQAHVFNSVVVRWGAPFIVLVIVAAEWHARGGGAALVRLWQALCVLVLLDWTWRFIPGAARLSMPADAQLVPGLRRRLVELSLLIWCGAMAGFLLTPPDASNGVFLLWVSGFTLGSALAMAGHAAGAPLANVTLLAVVFSDHVRRLVDPLVSGAALRLPVLLLCALAALLAVHAIFPQAGERHWRMIARRNRVATTADKRDPLAERVGGNWTRKGYSAALRSDAARRDSARLVLHALGPAHYVGELVAAVGMLALVLAGVAALILWRTGDPGVLAGLGWLFACTLLFLPLATSLRLSGFAARHGAEQALVRLAPAMPGTAPSFNRHLGRALLVLVLKGWALASGAALLLPLLGGADADTMLRQACICLLVLPVVAAPLRNHALRAEHAMIAPLLVLLAIWFASLGAGFAARTFGGAPVLPVAAAVALLATAFAVRQGLRTMASAPFAFPAARLD